MLPLHWSFILVQHHRSRGKKNYCEFCLGGRSASFLRRILDGFWLGVTSQWFAVVN